MSSTCFTTNKRPLNTFQSTVCSFSGKRNWGRLNLASLIGNSYLQVSVVSIRKRDNRCFCLYHLLSWCFAFRSWHTRSTSTQNIPPFCKEAFPNVTGYLIKASKYNNLQNSMLSCVEILLYNNYLWWGWNVTDKVICTQKHREHVMTYACAIN